MKTHLAMAAASLVVLAGCATDSAEPGVSLPSPTNSGATTSRASMTTTTPSSTTPSAPADVTVGNPPQADAASVPAPSSPSPTFVRCYLADGTALMSDGSRVYMDRCHESASHPNFDSDAARSWSECVTANGHDFCARQYAPAAAPSPDLLPEGFTGTHPGRSSGPRRSKRRSRWPTTGGASASLPTLRNFAEQTIPGRTRFLEPSIYAARGPTKGLRQHFPSRPVGGPPLAHQTFGLAERR